MTKKKTASLPSCAPVAPPGTSSPTWAYGDCWGEQGSDELGMARSERIHGGAFARVAAHAADPLTYAFVGRDSRLVWWKGPNGLLSKAMPVLSFSQVEGHDVHGEKNDAQPVRDQLADLWYSWHEHHPTSASALVEWTQKSILVTEALRLEAEKRDVDFITFDSEDVLESVRGELFKQSVNFREHEKWAILEWFRGHCTQYRVTETGEVDDRPTVAEDDLKPGDRSKWGEPDWFNDEDPILSLKPSEASELLSLLQALTGQIVDDDTPRFAPKKGWRTAGKVDAESTVTATPNPDEDAGEDDEDAGEDDEEMIVAEPQSLRRVQPAEDYPIRSIEDEDEDGEEDEDDEDEDREEDDEDEDEDREEDDEPEVPSEAPPPQNEETSAIFLNALRNAGYRIRGKVPLRVFVGTDLQKSDEAEAVRAFTGNYYLNRAHAQQVARAKITAQFWQAHAAGRIPKGRERQPWAAGPPSEVVVRTPSWPIHSGKRKASYKDISTFVELAREVEELIFELAEMKQTGERIDPDVLASNFAARDVILFTLDSYLLKWNSSDLAHMDKSVLIATEEGSEGLHLPSSDRPRWKSPTPISWDKFAFAALTSDVRRRKQRESLRSDSYAPKSAYNYYIIARQRLRAQAAEAKRKGIPFPGKKRMTFQQFILDRLSAMFGEAIRTDPIVLAITRANLNSPMRGHASMFRVDRAEGTIVHTEEFKKQFARSMGTHSECVARRIARQIWELYEAEARQSKREDELARLVDMMTLYKMPCSIQQESELWQLLPEGKKGHYQARWDTAEKEARRYHDRVREDVEQILADTRQSRFEVEEDSDIAPRTFLRRLTTTRVERPMTPNGAIRSFVINPIHLLFARR